ncbi:hypothetical protein DL546_006733 [Coniochaeta pulveracea]|uniref:Uncharacterized protein n=1 Tax=Coniochaeta pulveracea TaxID=177199 RepID=A0A420Y8I0_9PEZI|nr:hypothetical protein DL546_006733 [Coniochaeta pulveracea]
MKLYQTSPYPSASRTIADQHPSQDMEDMDSFLSQPCKTVWCRGCGRMRSSDHVDDLKAHHFRRAAPLERTETRREVDGAKKSMDEDTIGSEEEEKTSV